MIGFYCFDSAPVVVEPTMRQKVAALSTDTKTAIYNGFATKVPPPHLRLAISQPVDLIEYIYNGISSIQDRCRAYMRGEVEGVVAPASATVLRQTVAPEFIDDFPGADINSIVNMMIAQSKYDSKGTWNFYSTNIKL
jgi:hypothetical protein